jgi:integrase
MLQRCSTTDFVTYVLPMAKQRLTDTTIRNLKPEPGKQYERWDSDVTGLGVRVSPQGTKSFVFVYRLGTRQRRMTVGQYPGLSLKEARSKAREYRQLVFQGRDPAEEKKDQRRNVFAFDEFVRHFIQTYGKPKNRTWEESERLLARYFVKVWRKRDIRQIKKADVTNVIDAIVAQGNPTSANRAFAQIRKLFNWAVERGYLESSPCQGLKAPAKSNSRERVLSDDEIAAIWTAAERMDYPFGTVVKLLLLTGQRRDEVASMRWDEIDLDDGLWTLPADRNKSNRAHVVPLTPQAIAILKNVPRAHEVLVFPARGRDNSVSGFSKWKRKLDTLSGVSDWTLHDIRRTVSTGLAELGVRIEVTERILNHKTGALGGVAGIYNRFGYLAEVRAALESWSDHVRGLVESPTIAELSDAK